MARWSDRLPLTTYVRQQRVVDARLRKVLLDAANDARRRLNRLEHGSLRRLQLELQEHQLRLWAQMGTIINDGIVDNAKHVSMVNDAFTEALLKRYGYKVSDQFRDSMSAQARNTIRTYLARQNLGMTLSERVYKNGLVSSGRIDQIIDRALLRGASAREIARDVASFISPNTPGGVSYAAMRLGRTELNNSFHEAANETYNSNPFIKKVDWNLSSSHPRADNCDDLAASGPYSPGNVPGKPHPQCLCFTTPAVMPSSEFYARFKRGEFSGWLADQAA